MLPYNVSRSNPVPVILSEIRTSNPGIIPAILTCHPSVSGITQIGQKQPSSSYSFRNQNQQSWNNSYNPNLPSQRFWNNPNRPPPLLPTPAPSSSFSRFSQPPSTEPFCENCRLPGHTAYQCPKTRNVLCCKCRSVGHRQMFCRS